MSLHRFRLTAGSSRVETPRTSRTAPRARRHGHDATGKTRCGKNLNPTRVRRGVVDATQHESDPVYTQRQGTVPDRYPRRSRTVDGPVRPTRPPPTPTRSRTTALSSRTLRPNPHRETPNVTRRSVVTVSVGTRTVADEKSTKGPGPGSNRSSPRDLRSSVTRRDLGRRSVRYGGRDSEPTTGGHRTKDTGPTQDRTQTGVRP